MSDVPLDVAAVVEAPRMRVREILNLRVGAVIVTSRRAGANLDVYAGKARIGAGEFSQSGGRGAITMAQFGRKS